MLHVALSKVVSKAEEGLPSLVVVLVEVPDEIVIIVYHMQRYLKAICWEWG